MGYGDDQLQDQTSGVMSVERREYGRFEVALTLEVTGPDGDKAVGTTLNLSDGGVLVGVRFTPMPGIGDLLTARILSDEEDAPPRPVVTMRVIRITENGIAMAFVEPTSD